MNVLHVIPSLDPRSGGPVKAVQGLSEKLAERGIKVTVFATKNGGNESQIHLPSTVKSEVFSSYGPRNFAFSPSFRTAIQKHIKNFDLVHIHALWSFPEWMTSYYCQKTGVPYLVRPCGMLASYCLTYSSLQKKIYSFLVEKKNLLHAEAIHFTTQAEKDQSNGFGLTSQSAVIPLGLNVTDYSNLPPRGEFRNLHPELRGKKIILFLGRMTVRKGLDLMIQVFSQVVQKIKGAHLVIAGSDDEGYGKELKRWAEQQGIDHQVMLTGFLEGRQKFALLRDSDIFCLPSYYENFGIAIIEAMAAGLPVVISDQVNLHLEIQKAQAGFVEPCQVDRLTSALCRLLEDDQLQKTMGENGKKLVHDKYQWDVVADEVIKLYEHIARRHSR